MKGTDHLEYRNLHHRLIEIRRLVLHDLDSHHIVRLHILALDDLPERALAQHVQDQIPAPPQNSTHQRSSSKIKNQTDRDRDRDRKE